VSRIGRKPIVIPDKVNVTVSGNKVMVKGPLGALDLTVKGVTVKVDGDTVIVSSADDSRTVRALWGLNRTLINNMILGVSAGYTRVLEIQGVGYKAKAQGSVLNLALGHSHPINYQMPAGVTVEVDKKQTTVTLKGIDKATLGQTAATIRSFRPPEPYKGKGVRYQGEVVQRKAGKANK
jgi:large subunit ribosomal protein L6